MNVQGTPNESCERPRRCPVFRGHLVGLKDSAGVARDGFPSLARVRPYETEQVSHFGRFNLVRQTHRHQREAHRREGVDV